MRHTVKINGQSKEGREGGRERGSEGGREEGREEMREGGEYFETVFLLCKLTE